MSSAVLWSINMHECVAPRYIIHTVLGPPSLRDGTGSREGGREGGVDWGAGLEVKCAMGREGSRVCVMGEGREVGCHGFLVQGEGGM